jgi:hypothetical protein
MVCRSFSPASSCTQEEAISARVRLVFDSLVSELPVDWTLESVEAEGRRMFALGPRAQVCVCVCVCVCVEEEEEEEGGALQVPSRASCWLGPGG